MNPRIAKEINRFQPRGLRVDLSLKLAPMLLFAGPKEDCGSSQERHMRERVLPSRMIHALEEEDMESRAVPRSAGSRRRAPGNLWRLSIAVAVLVVMGLVLGARAEAAPPTVPGATYVGSDTCKGCHEDQFKKMESSLHGKLLGTKLSRNDLQQHGCEACHGPGSKHLEDQANPANNLRFGKKSLLSAADKSAVCLQCHQRGKRMLWRGSPHDSRDVSCVTCHSVHGPASEKGQLKIVKAQQYDSRGLRMDTVQSDLCGQCHQMRGMQFNRYSHMPLAARGEAGALTCTSCHNPHGTTTEKLIAAVSITESCTSCHADKRGPFLWEHPPVLENCLNCHQAHGSNNPSLLKVKQPRLCETCHVGGRHNAQTYAQTDRKVFNRSCVNCHANIHGSNHPSGVFFTR
jgi:DmsE family decaheme c-type cytochrome